MKDGTGGSRYSKLAAGLAFGAALWTTPAFADPPAGAPPAAPPDAPAMPDPAPAPAPAPAVMVEAKPPTATETMAATRPDVLPPIDVGAWTRVGGRFQGTDAKKLNDWHMDNAYVELHAGGKITKKVGVTLNLNANMINASEGGGPVMVEDAIVSFDFQDELHLWAGHLLVPVDRSNASGPFFMIPWNYPGFFAAGKGIVGAPKEGPAGRNNGAVIWGDVQGGKFSYFAGAFDNADIGTSPLFSGRVRIALLDPEPGFWGNGSYFGDKDLFTINIGGQFQKHGSAGTMTAAPVPPATVGVTTTTDKDYAEVNADVLFEKKLGGGAFFTAEGAYYHFNVLDGGVSDAGYVLAAYAMPVTGGALQPMVRYQFDKVKGTGAATPWNLDVGLSYLIKGPALRVLATYGHTDFDAASATANYIQLGAQAIFF